MSLPSATNALNIASDTLTIDALNSRVGIGTSAPSSKLHVVGDLGVDVTTNMEGIKLISSSVTKMAMKWINGTARIDVPSGSAVNKLSNGTFETDLSGWTYGHILDDQFTTDRAAGAVNGTSAEPTGGTRTVTDTESKLSISSGLLQFENMGTAG